MPPKKKRAPGGGRKPGGEFSHLTAFFGVRMPHDLREQLEAAAEKTGRSASQELLARLNSSLTRQREKERDPALRGLLFLIAQLAERIGGGQFMADSPRRSYLQKSWRTDLFKFRAFKFAVRKLLEALEEPPGELLPPYTKENLAGNPEAIELFLERNKTPEAYASNVLAWLLEQSNRSSELSEREKALIREYPQFAKIWEREYYGFQRVRQDLQLSDSAADLKSMATKPKSG
jgi:hypothetical protein